MKHTASIILALCLATACQKDDMPAPTSTLQPLFEISEKTHSEPPTANPEDCYHQDSIIYLTPVQQDRDKRKAP